MIKHFCFENKKGRHGNAAPCKIQYPMKNQGETNHLFRFMQVCE